MSTPRSIAIETAGPAHREALLDLFDRAGCPCFCRYFHFEGDKNAWLDRCFNAPGESRRELATALDTGSEEARGVVAIESGAGRAVGWLKVTPVTSVRKAYEQRFYRGLTCFGGDRTGVFLIGCALVDPAHRRSGLAGAMVAHAVAVARSWGARALEAFPRRPREPVTDEELWTVPEGAFRGLGFVEVSATDPYPVLRCTLD